MRRWILFVAFGIACTLIEPARAQDSLPSENAGVVGFDLTADFLVVVEAQAGDVGGSRFIVDTGATRSVIDRKLALRLGLKRQGGQIVNFDRWVPIEWADLPEFQMGPLRAQGLQVMVADLSEYSESAKGVDGIVGLDLLSRTQKFSIDYEKKMLYFELAPNGTSRPVPACFVAPIVVQGTTLWLGVDTGLAEILLYKNRLKGDRVEIRTVGKPKNVNMGRVKGTEVTLPGVQLGGPERVITAILIDGPPQLKRSTLDGYLGTGLLHATRIEFDFANMVLRWQ
jgi:predicted aspartyl protease